MMNAAEVIEIASSRLKGLKGIVFDDLSLAKPRNSETAVNLAKIISKLSPFVGNLLEFNTVVFLNEIEEFKPFGTWKRQDPGFPDAIFEGNVTPAPGFEIKTWFPLATEITARFKDSQNNFKGDQIYVAILAWLPEFLIYGKPRIVDIVIVSGLSVAQARDNHYHNPPDYLVVEPEDTTARTRNLQQTNTNGYKFQGTTAELERAREIVTNWGKNGLSYQSTPEYQIQIRELMGKYRYRLDTNFAKMDRIVHDEIELFKRRVYSSDYAGMSIAGWKKLLGSSDNALIQQTVKQHLHIS